MQLTHYISPDEIVIPLRATTKEAAYKELVKYLAEHKKLNDINGLTKAIFDREASTSTFLPIGVAIPHARVPAIKDIEVVMGVSPNPIMDTAPDSPPITANVFCLFFSPTEEKEFGRHLKLLARIAAVFSDTNLVSDLSKLHSADEVFERIQRRERQMSEE
jgi:PTS system fructose-specific IIC component